MYNQYNVQAVYKQYDVQTVYKRYNVQAVYKPYNAAINARIKIAKFEQAVMNE